jgi:hypothetical protein
MSGSMIDVKTKMPAFVVCFSWNHQVTAMSRAVAISRAR